MHEQDARPFRPSGRLDEVGGRALAPCVRVRDVSNRDLASPLGPRYVHLERKLPVGERLFGKWPDLRARSLGQTCERQRERREGSQRVASG